MRCVPDCLQYEQLPHTTAVFPAERDTRARRSEAASIVG